MAQKIIVMAGSGQFDLPRLHAVAADFGFEVETAPDLSDLPTTAAAVLFHRDAFGPVCSWFDAIGLLRARVPDARLIPCLGFSEAIDWDALTDDGAYHALWLPLRESELRQCLGFVWDSEQHPALVEFNRIFPGRSHSPSHSPASIHSSGRAA